MRVRALFCCVVVALVLAAGCGNDGGVSLPTSTPTPAAAPITVATGKPLTVGLSVALSGDQRIIGEDLAVAADLAVEDFGAAIKGHPIAVSRRDDGCTDAARAVEVAGLLVADPTLAGVVGPMCTAGAQAANPRYEAASVVHVSPSATRDELSQQGARYFFRTAWYDAVQSQVQARYAFESLGAQTATVIDDGEPYGSGLAEAFIAAYEDMGGRVVGHSRIERGTADFDALARQVSEQAPAIVVFEGLNPEGALFVKALRAAGYTGEFMGPDGLLSIRDFVPIAGPAAEGAILTGGPVAEQQFTDRFVARAQRPPSTPFILQAYDAVTALLRAADAVATEEDGALVIDREALAETMRSQRFAGLSGSITFDEHGDRRGETPLELGLRIYRLTAAGLVIVE